MYSWSVCESKNKKQQQKSVKRETIHRKKRSWFFSKSCEHLAQWFSKCDPEIYWHLYDLCRASTGQNCCHDKILYWLVFSVGSLWAFLKPPWCMTTSVIWWPIECVLVRSCVKTNKQTKQKPQLWVFPGCTVEKNLPTKAGEMGSTPDLGASHVPWSH